MKRSSFFFSAVAAPFLSLTLVACAGSDEPAQDPLVVHGSSGAGGTSSGGSSGGAGVSGAHSGKGSLSGGSGGSNAGTTGASGFPSGSAGGSGDATGGMVGQAGTTQSTAGSAGSAGGNNGIAGTTGVAGTTGSAGTNGIGGTPGTAGTTNTAGNGTAGTNGVAGTNGSAGTTGTAGNTGTAGTTGAGGDAGTTGTAGSSGQGGNSTWGGLAAVVSRDLFDEMFPQRNALYSYDALLAAAADYPAFASEGSLDDRKREVAAFFANMGHETTGGWPTAPGGPYSWGLYFTQEVGCETGACTGYCDSTNTTYPCAPGKTYHGRGPIQLSWNYNYGAVGDVLGLPLLTDPDLVTSDGTVAFKTAVWFWMTPQPPKPSAHAVMTGGWTPTAQDTSLGRAPGFGMTVNIINGGLECNIGPDSRVDDRIGFYTRFTTLLAVDPGSTLDCETMASF
jgi:basic endochitinase B